jgi:hypothetical protein
MMATPALLTRMSMRGPKVLTVSAIKWDEPDSVDRSDSMATQ